MRLVPAIICDWNVRAWTFFEAFRARRTMHLLCRNNDVVSLKQVVQFVLSEGALDVGILLVAVPHFLPPLDDRKSIAPKSENREQFEAGHLPIETSSSLLSHRPASRPGDDFVIWSLLISKKTKVYTAEAFWKRMQGLAFRTSAKTENIFSSAASIRTGYLISSAPRLKTRGLGWAPASPALQPSIKSEQAGLYGCDDGGRESGHITADGLVAAWWLCKFDGTGFWSMMHSVAARLWMQSPNCHNLAKIREQYLQGYRWGRIPNPLAHDFKVGDDPGVWWEDGRRLRRKILVVRGTNKTNGLVVDKYTCNSSIPTNGK